MKSDLTSKDVSISIVISEFNQLIIERLLNGAKNAFIYYGGDLNSLKIYRVPGALEIPGTINKILNKSNPDAIVALGSIIRGDTFHFEIVAVESSRGIAELSRSADIPIINGILSTDNVKQASERSIEKNNKGWDAIKTALKTIKVYNNISMSA